jgi:hypothetical protein
MYSRVAQGPKLISGSPEEGDEVTCPYLARVGFVGILLAGPVGADVAPMEELETNGGVGDQWSVGAG